jgi:hypothetical protein
MWGPGSEELETTRVNQVRTAIVINLVVEGAVSGQHRVGASPLRSKLVEPAGRGHWGVKHDLRADLKGDRFSESLDEGGPGIKRVAGREPTGDEGSHSLQDIGELASIIHRRLISGHRYRGRHKGVNVSKGLAPMV